MKTLYLFLLIIGISFTACSKPQQNIEAYVKKEKTPSWYLSVKNDDGNYFYSTGEGENKKEAIASALSALVSRFQVTVQSSYTSKKEMDTFVSDNVYKKIDKETKLKTNAIKISNYEVINLHEESFDKLLVQIRVNKQKLADDTNEKIRKHIELSNKKIKNVSNDGFLEKYRIYKELYIKNEETYNDIKLLEYLNFKYNKSYDKFLNNIEEKYLFYKKNLVVRLQFDKNSKGFDKSIQAFLVSKQISFNNKNNASSLKIKVNTKTSRNRSMGINLVIFDMTFNLISKNKIVDTKSIVLKVGNKGDMNLVYKNANIHLLKQLEKEELFKDNFDY